MEPPDSPSGRPQDDRPSLDAPPAAAPETIEQASGATPAQDPGATLSHHPSGSSITKALDLAGTPGATSLDLDGYVRALIDSGLVAASEVAALRARVEEGE